MRNFPIIMFMLLNGCASCSSNPQPNIIIKDDINDCAPACLSIQELGCPEGENLVYPDSCTGDSECETGICLDGFCTETCQMLCEALVKEGRQLGLECWQTISSCDQIESICRNN